MGGSKGTQINTVNNGRTGTANIAGSKSGVAINTFNNDGTFNIKLMNLVMPATNATKPATLVPAQIAHVVYPANATQPTHVTPPTHVTHPRPHTPVPHTRPVHPSPVTVQNHNEIVHDNTHNINILNEVNDGTQNPMMYINTESHFDLPKGNVLNETEANQQFILFLL